MLSRSGLPRAHHRLKVCHLPRHLLMLRESPHARNRPEPSIATATCGLASQWWGSRLVSGSYVGRHMWRPHLPRRGRVLAAVPESRAPTTSLESALSQPAKPRSARTAGMSSTSVSVPNTDRVLDRPDNGSLGPLSTGRTMAQQCARTQQSNPLLLERRSP